MSKKVLICDDEDVLRSLVHACLRRRDVEVLEARDGEEALELARTHVPDLILLDLMMPRRSGLGVLEGLQGEPALGAIPVVMLTARTQETDRAAAASAGARRFLPKPFRPAELLAAVDELLPES